MGGYAKQEVVGWRLRRDAIYCVLIYCLLMWGTVS